MATLVPDRASMFSEIGLDKQNKAGLGRLLTNGPIAQAEEGADGRMSTQIRIPDDELIYSTPRSSSCPMRGELEIEFVNDDTNTHCAQVPSNGDYQVDMAAERLTRKGHTSPSTARATTGSAPT